MNNLRRLFAFLAVVGCILGFAGRSEAQVVTLQPAGVVFTRTDRGNLKNTQINYEDCHENSAIKFTVSLTGAFTGLNLQVWAGSGCDNPTNRVTIPICNMITSQSATQLNPPPFEIPIQQILFERTLSSGTGSTSTAGAGGTAGTGGDSASGGDVGTGGSTAGAGGAAVVSSGEPECTDKTGNSAIQNISVYLMLMDPSNNVMGTFATWNGTYKLVAPAPPTKVTPGIGEDQVPVSFTTDTSDTTINGYNIYCDPPPGSEAAADAGLLPVDGGAPLACAGSLKLIAGQRPDPSLLCGNTGARANSGTAKGLLNGVPYNVAVATTDSYYNSGVLSNVVCQVPQPVTGFYQAYRDAGGEGGGGFCSFSRHREPLTLLAVLGFGTYLVLRRRRAT